MGIAIARGESSGDDGSQGLGDRSPLPISHYRLAITHYRLAITHYPD
ncbi:MAG: hypothetical protein F6K63_35250 [Moorea sp. SIO1G6]|nr:hypothetical protein [Moorena sp. SIO1G6]NET69358.1 hypothetical protein [Moorena sp. SIO1G6]